jgi:hypothetical protein
MFQFTPKKDEDFMLAVGDANYTVLKATQKESKSGNPMIELQLQVWDKNGKEGVIYDYLLNIPSMEHKIKHFCESCGLEDKYNQGCFEDSDCEGKSGKLILFIQKDKHGVHPDKAAVKDYLKVDASNAAKVPFNDDIPF